MSGQGEESLLSNYIKQGELYIEGGTYLGFELGWGLCIKGLGPGLYNILVHFSSTSYST